MTDEQYREAAREHYCDGTPVDVDDDAIVSRGSDSGAYVAAWVWVADDDLPEGCGSIDDPDHTDEADAKEGEQNA
jgi:hypothetical protein